MMSEKDLFYSSNNVSFMQVSGSNPQISSFCLKEFVKNQNDHFNNDNDESKAKIYDISSNETVRENDLLIEETNKCNKNPKNSPSKSISSEPRLPSPSYYKKELSFDIPSLKKREKKCQSMPNKMSNKMTIQKTRQMSLGGHKINQNNLKNIEINGKQIKAGLGFPTKMPHIVNKKSDILLKTENFFDELENLIHKIKEDDNPLSNNSSNDFNNKIHALLYDGNDPKMFNEIEENILNEISDVKSSIDQLLVDRKSIQMQHKLWLQDMKKKIFQAKKDTVQFENEFHDSSGEK